MKFVVLISTLNAEIDKIIEETQINSDLIIVNQTDFNDLKIFRDNNINKIICNSSERGVAKSRNKAMQLALEYGYEIALFADDDVMYYPEYVNIISEVYKKQKKADMVIFNIDKHYDVESRNFNNNKVHEKTYLVKRDKLLIKKFAGTVRISVKTSFVKEHNVVFNERFGPGSGEYSHGEDALFINDFRKLKAKIFWSSDYIASVDYTVEKSTWKNKDKAKIMYDKGALWSIISPKLFWIYGLLLVPRMSNVQNWIKNYLKFLQGGICYEKRTID